MNTEIKNIALLEVNNENIESSFNKIKEFADSKGYVIKGEMKIPTNLIGMNKSMHFDSNKQKKRFRNYINRIHKKTTMRTANIFLHVLFKKIYQLDTAPSVEYSEKEISIQNSRKAWKKVQAEADKLHLAYIKEKGDFYKTK